MSRSSVCKAAPKRIALLVMALLSMMAPGAEPAAASSTVAGVGDIAFEGTASLPLFPCTGTCGGWFDGTWSGHLTGVHNDAAYSVTWKTVVDKVHASFSYTELLCAAPGSGAVAGTATGSVNANASFDNAEVVGAWYSANPNELPRLITHVSLGAAFEWVRVGNTAVIVLRPAWVSIHVAGLGWKQVVVGTQRGVATFVPTHSDQPAGIVSCDVPLTGVEGEIAGNVPISMPAV
jgi:hypothetical protein